jgi:WD40 repeat protein
VQRKIAHLIEVKDYDEVTREQEVSLSHCGAPSSISAAATALKCCWRGHRLSATAVSLSSDDKFAVTVSKDGSIIKWDLDTMKKTEILIPGVMLRSSSS